jgi:acyl-CoA synthetase (AMP-forming)/AMP-acid ligase II
VALTEVERAFDGVPGLGAVCAVALPDPALGSVVALVIEDGEAAARDASATGDDGTTDREAPSATKESLRAHASAHLAPQFVPRRWYRVSVLPRTVGGKIRREATADIVRAGEAQRL